MSTGTSLFGSLSNNIGNNNNQVTPQKSVNQGNLSVNTGCSKIKKQYY